MINISKTFYQMERYDEARDWFGKASAVDPDRAKEFAYLSEKAQEATRAARQTDPARDILFIED
jgi:tetratricopeptide (TPR) repeat protein